MTRRLTRHQKIFIAKQAVRNSQTQEQFLRAMARLRKLTSKKAK